MSPRLLAVQHPQSSEAGDLGVRGSGSPGRRRTTRRVGGSTLLTAGGVIDHMNDQPGHAGAPSES